MQQQELFVVHHSRGTMAQLPITLPGGTNPSSSPLRRLVQWVMPNRCTMGCQSKFAKYQEYFNLKVDKKTKGERMGGR